MGRVTPTLCGWFVEEALASFLVGVDDVILSVDCNDSFNSFYFNFMAKVPPGVTLVAGQTYALGIYGVLRDPDGPCNFYWNSTAGRVGLPAYEFNTITGGQEQCLTSDRSFCISTCAADLDGDGALTVFDFLAFQTFFGNGKQAADLDSSGTLNVFDFLRFQTAFGDGC